MKNTKYSRQRELLMQNLKSRYDHPTAEQLYESLRGEISLPTIYRNLSELCDNCKVLRIGTGGADRFDAVTSDHAHFSCNICGQVSDIEPNLKIKPGEIIDDCVITGSNIMLFGICRLCKNKTN